MSQNIVGELRSRYAQALQRDQAAQFLQARDCIVASIVDSKKVSPIRLDTHCCRRRTDFLPLCFGILTWTRLPRTLDRDYNVKYWRNDYRLADMVHFSFKCTFPQIFPFWRMCLGNLHVQLSGFDYFRVR